jgi:hypothetical protein
MKTKTHSTNYLAIEFGIDRATATRVLKDIEPDEMTNGRPTYSISTFARALEEHHLANASNNDGANDGGPSDTSSLMAARVRITLANAEAKERENLIAAGKLCDVEAIGDEFERVLRVHRETLLAIPGKITDRLSPHSASDRGAIMQTIQREIYDCMDAIRNALTAINDQYKARVTATASSIEIIGRPETEQ